MAEKTESFEGFAILELMGHRKLAGFVRETTLAGAGVLRLDIPGATESEPSTTQYYAPSSLYCLTPCTEDVARRAATVYRPQPVSRFDLPRERAIEAPARERQGNLYDSDAPEPSGDGHPDEEDDPDEDRDDDRHRDLAERNAAVARGDHGPLEG